MVEGESRAIKDIARFTGIAGSIFAGIAVFSVLGAEIIVNQEPINALIDSIPVINGLPRFVRVLLEGYSASLVGVNGVMGLGGNLAARLFPPEGGWINSPNPRY